MKNVGVLRLGGLYLTKPYIVFDESLQTQFLQFECDVTIEFKKDLEKQLSYFDNAEPIELLIYHPTDKEPTK